MRPFLAAVTAFVVLAAACSAGDEIVGTVGDTDVTVGQVAVLFDTDAIEDESFAVALYRLTAVTALQQALQDDFGVTVSEARIDDEFQDLVAQMEAADVTPDVFLGIPGAGLEMLRFNGLIISLRATAVEQLTVGEAFLAELAENPGDITTVCVRHVLVATAEEASDVEARLADGEDLGEVANEVSLDTGTPDGDLGCSVASRYVPEFRDASITAPLGEYFGPVESQFGFHVLQVYDRIAPTAEELAADPAAYLSPELEDSLWNEWFTGVLDAADVTVAEEYGTWTPAGIQPPEA